MPSVTVSSMKEANELVDKFVHAFQEEYAMVIKEDAKMILDTAGTSDTGGLSNSIVVQKTGEGVIVAARAPHASFIEYGTFPHWAPIGPLKAWAMRKLGDEQAAYAIQKKIAAKGTPAQPFMDPAMEGAFEGAYGRALKAFGMFSTSTKKSVPELVKSFRKGKARVSKATRPARKAVRTFKKLKRASRRRF